MTTIRVQIKTNGGMAEIRRAMDSLRSETPAPEIQAWQTQTLSRVETYIRRRFNLFSRGGGNWPPLALSTIRARRGAPTKQQSELRSRGKDRRGRDIALTVARDTRRGGGIVDAGRQAQILADTGVLRNALTLNQTGNVSARIKGGVRYAIGGGAMHGGKAPRPSTRKRSVPAGAITTTTIGQLAQWHDEGAGRLPQRKILVPPDTATTARITNDLNRNLRKMIARAGKEGA
jgi:hypothetical protein